MRRVVVDMKNFLFADAVALALKNADSDFEVFRSDCPENTADLCGLASPYALLMEVVDCPAWNMDARLQVRAEALRRAPHCKTIFVVDEKAGKKLLGEVRQAKKDGLIDQFVYGSVTAAYLVAVIDTL